MKIEILSAEEIKRIHEGTLEILSNVGVKVEGEEARNILKQAGAEVDHETNVCRIPGDLVMKSVRRAPKEIKLYGRAGKNLVHLKGDNTYFSTNGYAIFVYDVDTGERRELTKEDFVKAIIVGDALENCDLFSNLPATPCDVPARTGDRYQWALAFSNTTKHICSESFGREAAKDAIEMGAAIAGSLESLRKRPLLSFDVATISPLVHGKMQTQELLEGAKHGLPVSIGSGPMAGAVSPVTLAGTTMVANAEVLSSIVISQLTNPGAPVIYASWSRTFDMKSANVSVGSPEFAMLRVCTAQIAKFYGLPCRGGGILTDSKIPDTQSGYEKMLTCIMPALAGLNIIAGMAMCDAIKTLSFEQFIIDNEIVAMVRRVLKGIKVDDETLAISTVKEVGPGGNFLATRHTFKHFKDELWVPKISSRTTWLDWHRRGDTTTKSEANKIVKQILATHKPEELHSSVQKEIWEIVKKADEKYASEAG